MTPEALLECLREKPSSVQFEQVIDTINEYYQYTPSAFNNGEGAEQVKNAAGENEGSCKILFFAMMHELGEAHTLALFGKFYREEVLLNPKGTGHANIRAFLKSGWAHVEFEHEVLVPKAAVS